MADCLDCLKAAGFLVDGTNISVPGNKIQVDEWLVAAIATGLGASIAGPYGAAGGAFVAAAYSQINDQLFYGPDMPIPPDFSGIHEIEQIRHDVNLLRGQIITDPLHADPEELTLNKASDVMGQSLGLIAGEIDLESLKLLPEVVGLAGILGWNLPDTQIIDSSNIVPSVRILQSITAQPELETQLNAVLASLRDEEKTHFLVNFSHIQPEVFQNLDGLLNSDGFTSENLQQLVNNPWILSALLESADGSNSQFYQLALSNPSIIEMSEQLVSLTTDYTQLRTDIATADGRTDTEVPSLAIRLDTLEGSLKQYQESLAMLSSSVLGQNTRIDELAARISGLAGRNQAFHSADNPEFQAPHRRADPEIV